MLSRRDFLITLSRLAVTAGGTGIILSDPLWQKFLLGGNSGLAFGESYLDELARLSPKARYWKTLTFKDGSKEKTIVRCLLCANGCAIVNGQRGRCRTRMNINGELRSLVYGRPLSIHIDPIEKNRFTIIYPERPHSLWPPPDVRSAANSVKTGKFPSHHRKIIRFLLHHLPA